MSQAIRITVWNEVLHEEEHEAVRRVYPGGLHKAIGGCLSEQGVFRAGYATLQDPEHGLGQEVVEASDSGGIMRPTKSRNTSFISFGSRNASSKACFTTCTF